MEKIIARKGAAKDEYPEIMKRVYGKIYEKLDEMKREDLEELIDMVYSTAYLDGAKDTLLLEGKL